MDWKKLLLGIGIVLLIIIVFAYHSSSSSEGLKIAQSVVTLHYTDWCPHCKTLMPIWQEVKAQVHSVNPGIMFREVNEQKTPTTGILAVPTIILTDRAGRTYRYPGPNTVDGLIKWIMAPVH